ncbi:MAG: nucleotide sugar dehydrogenase [Alphaproteobacteria bacterium]|nr:nucleotide sugar dehydrogenase [Alphaproteobacteria bacterium]
MKNSVRPKLVKEQIDFSEILQKIKACKATVAIMGMGYVGFPLAIATHKQGFSVLAFDIDKEKIKSLNAGKSYLNGIADADVKNMVATERFHATTDVQKLKEADALIMCVPTPLTKNREPDLSFVEATTAMIASQLRSGQLVVLESTTYPGTTDELIKPMLEATGLVCGKDFFLAYSPEREDPGNGYFSTHSIPKVVGADDKKSQKLAVALYNNIVSKAVLVSSAATAEAVKLTENIFRSINIALMNELKMVFTKMDIDVWEVIEAAKTKPFGFMPFYPGPGVGGHCIPLDPFYLTWKSREYGMPTRFIELAGQINERMPGYVITKVREGLDEHLRKGLNGSKILVLGIAYKKDVDDMRESPSLFIFERLLEYGAQVDYHDPLIPVIPHTREHDHLSGLKSVALSVATLANYDAVVIATDHSGVDYPLVVENSRLIIDTRNATAACKPKPYIVKA